MGGQLKKKKNISNVNLVGLTYDMVVEKELNLFKIIQGGKMMVDRWDGRSRVGAG